MNDSKLLNVGCGRCVHPDWLNVDLDPQHPLVQRVNLLTGLPFEDGRFDAVYHSHVLEHLEPTAARRLIVECRRVLRPGGILRIAVPDLEQITRLYLETLDRCVRTPNATDLGRHRWMTIELIDQMTRTRSGGTMAATMARPGDIDGAWIESRMGNQLQTNSNLDQWDQRSLRQTPKIGKWFRKARVRCAELAIAALLGRSSRRAFREGMFRNIGEVHRWMYDRVSLRQLLESAGFDDVRVCDATDSGIDRYADYQLDHDGQRVRKPDSLFVEASAGRNAAAYRAAA